MPDDVSLLDDRSSLSLPWIRILKRNIGRNRHVLKGLTLQVGVENSTVAGNNQRKMKTWPNGVNG